MKIVHLNIDMLIFLNVVAYKLEDNFITLGYQPLNQLRTFLITRRIKN